MLLINTNLIGRGRRVAAVLAALAAAPLVLSALANADPDPDPSAPVVDPKATCESREFDGVFVAGATTPDGVTHAACQYIISGHFYYDNYDNGVYTGTLVYRDGAKVPTERPQLPEMFAIPSELPNLPFPGQF